MADRDTNVVVGSETGSGALVVLFVLVLLVVMGALYFTGVIPLGGPAPANSVTVNIPVAPVSPGSK